MKNFFIPPGSSFLAFFTAGLSGGFPIAKQVKIGGGRVSKGLTNNSTSVPVSQRSWVTMKESVLTKKKKPSRETGKDRNPLSGNILLCTSICCSVMADSQDGEREEEEEEKRSVFPE